MAMNHKGQISTSQTAAAISSIIIGAGLLTIPRTITEKIESPDGWLAFIIGGLLMMIPAWIMVKLSGLFPHQTFFEYNRLFAGKWLGALLTLFYCIYFIIFSAYEIRSMSEVINYSILESTPQTVIIFIFLAAELYLLVGGINPLVRLIQFLLPVTLIVLFLALCLSFKIFEINNIRPVLGLGIEPIMNGLPEMTLPYAGFESILILMGYMKRPQSAQKAVFLGVGIASIVYAFTMFMVIGGLSVQGSVDKTWPTFTLMQSFEIQGAFFERFESLMLVVWVLKIFTVSTLCHYIASTGLSQLFKNNTQLFTYLLMPAIFILTLIPRSMNDIFALGELLGHFFLFSGVILPAIMLSVAIIRRKKNVSAQNMD